MTTNFRQSFRIAITTRYAGPTNFKGSRIIVTSGNGHRMIVSWDDALDVGENHAAAAKALADRMEWDGEWIGGGTKDGYVFVNLPKPEIAGETHYDKELAAVQPGQEFPVAFQFRAEKHGGTKWLNLNAESAGALRRMLSRLGF